MTRLNTCETTRQSLAAKPPRLGCKTNQNKVSKRMPKTRLSPHPMAPAPAPPSSPRVLAARRNTEGRQTPNKQHAHLSPKRRTTQSHKSRVIPKLRPERGQKQPSGAHPPPRPRRPVPPFHAGRAAPPSPSGRGARAPQGARRAARASTAAWPPAPSPSPRVGRVGSPRGWGCAIGTAWRRRSWRMAARREGSGGSAPEHAHEHAPPPWTVAGRMAERRGLRSDATGQGRSPQAGTGFGA